MGRKKRYVKRSGSGLIQGLLTAANTFKHLKIHIVNRIWWCTSLTPALGRQRAEARGALV